MQRRSFLTGVAAATALGAPARTHAQGLATVRCGSVPLDGYGQPYYGVAAGIFRDAGIDLQITDLANSGAIAAAITGGSLDIGLGSVSQIAGAKEKGLPFTFFAPGAVYSADSPSSELMVEKNSPIRSARDLIGKTVAVDNLTSFTQFATLEWLKKNGVDPASVKFVELPYPAMPAALETGRVDAASIAEPARTVALATARIVSRHECRDRADLVHFRLVHDRGVDRGEPGACPSPGPGRRANRRSGPTPIRQRRPSCSRRSRKCRTTSF